MNLIKHNQIFLQKFESKHSGGFHSHSTINIPDEMSEDAKSLLLSVRIRIIHEIIFPVIALFSNKYMMFQILKHQPNERFTIPEIKRHPFFAKVDWLKLLNS